MDRRLQYNQIPLALSRQTPWQRLNNLLGNDTIGHSNTLFRAYNPVDLEKVRIADENRLKARRKRNAS